jgi:ribonuclease I
MVKRGKKKEQTRKQSEGVEKDQPVLVGLWKNRENITNCEDKPKDSRCRVEQLDRRRLDTYQAQF